jgi:hypothetical protein
VPAEKEKVVPGDAPETMLATLSPGRSCTVPGGKAPPPPEVVVVETRVVVVAGGLAVVVVTGAVVVTELVDVVVEVN